MKSACRNHVVLLLLIVLLYSCNAFHFGCRSFPLPSCFKVQVNTASLCIPLSASMVLYSGFFPDESDDDEDDEPGKMRVSEIKAELDLRKVSYADCFDKDSLVQRLTKARKEGAADPSILETFNKLNLDGIFSGESVQTMMKDMQDSDLEAAIAKDGTIPGGLKPDVFKKLISNPEILASLSSTKLQDAMKLMMTGNQSELEKKMEQDSELRQIVDKLDSTLKSIGLF